MTITYPKFRGGNSAGCHPLFQSSRNPSLLLHNGQTPDASIVTDLWRHLSLMRAITVT